MADRPTLYEDKLFDDAALDAGIAAIHGEVTFFDDASQNEKRRAIAAAVNAVLKALRT
jgi:hypothetical protein